MPLPQTDDYAGRADVSSQGESWAAVTPTDSALGILSKLPKALWIGVAGDIALIGADNAAVTFTVPAGILPLRPKQVKATGTTATGIVAIY